MTAGMAPDEVRAIDAPGTPSSNKPSPWKRPGGSWQLGKPGSSGGAVTVTWTGAGPISGSEAVRCRTPPR